MKAIWQAKGVTPTFLGANKKSDFSNALPYWPTNNALACHFSKRIFAVADELVNFSRYSRPLKSFQVAKNLPLGTSKKFWILYFCAHSFSA